MFDNDVRITQPPRVVTVMALRVGGHLVFALGRKRDEPMINWRFAEAFAIHPSRARNSRPPSAGVADVTTILRRWLSRAREGPTRCDDDRKAECRD